MAVLNGSILLVVRVGAPQWAGNSFSTCMALAIPRRSRRLLMRGAPVQRAIPARRRNGFFSSLGALNSCPSSAAGPPHDSHHRLPVRPPATGHNTGRDSAFPERYQPAWPAADRLDRRRRTARRRNAAATLQSPRTSWARMLGVSRVRWSQSNWPSGERQSS